MSNEVPEGVSEQEYRRSLEKARLFFSAFPGQSEPICFTNGEREWSISPAELEQVR